MEKLGADPRCAQVCGLSRHSDPAIDFNAPDSIPAAAKALLHTAPWHVIVVATGMLTGPTGGPEKRLADLNAAHLAASFATNTIGPALVLAHFAPLLARGERSLLAVLSAKVGSIGDNRLGGWYSYRAAKAALNMLLRTASIEMARTHPQAVLAALHPGTVDSALSAPFRGAQIGRAAADAAAADAAAAGAAPADAAHDLLAVLDGLQPEDSGSFWAYDGRRLPW